MMFYFKPVYVIFLFCSKFYKIPPIRAVGSHWYVDLISLLNKIVDNLKTAIIILLSVASGLSMSCTKVRCVLVDVYELCGK